MIDQSRAALTAIGSETAENLSTNAAHIEARLREIDGLLQQQSGLAGQLTEGLSAGLEQLSARFAALENDGGARNQRLGDAISALTQEAERMEHALASGNVAADRSEEHTSELQSLMRTSYAVFCLKKKRNTKTQI